MDYTDGRWEEKKVVDIGFAPSVVLTQDDDIIVPLCFLSSLGKYNMEGEKIVEGNTKLSSNEESNPSCVAVNSQGIIYMTDRTSSYKIFSRTCQLIRHITVLVDNKQTKLYGLAIDDNNVVFVGDRNSNFILKYNENNKEIGRIRVDIWPVYLAVTQQGSIIVCGDYNVQVRNVTSGNVIQTLSSPDGWWPWQVTSYGDFVFIADGRRLGNGGIVVFRLNTNSQHYQFVRRIQTSTIRDGVCGVDVKDGRIVATTAYPYNKLVILHKV